MPNTKLKAPLPAPIFTPASTKHLSRKALLDILNESYYYSLREEKEHYRANAPVDLTLLQIIFYLKRVTTMEKNSRNPKRS